MALGLLALAGPFAWAQPSFGPGARPAVENAAPVAAQNRQVAATDWQPARTWVLAVGVLHWQGNSFASFPQEGRRDVELVDCFLAAGVPREQVVFLRDEEATQANIDQSLRSQFANTRQGDLLVVYFAGHGTRTLDDAGYFANYDATSGNVATMWSVSSLVDNIEANFQGSRALLMADCCHSGGLAVAVDRQDRRVEYACLGSASVRSASTGRWTFTECLLAGLRGEGRVDGNRDGSISIQEWGEFCQREMAFTEEQMMSFHTTREFGKDFVLAQDAAPPVEGVGRHVWALWEGQWYKAEVLKKNGDQAFIHYVGFGDSWDEWIGPTRMRAFAPKSIKTGTAVSILWKNRRYPGTILGGWYGLHRVHYDGYGAEWDEWVSPDRLRVK